jgi:hypothetical protein
MIVMRTTATNWNRNYFFLQRNIFADFFAACEVREMYYTTFFTAVIKNALL